MKYTILLKASIAYHNLKSSHTELSWQKALIATYSKGKISRGEAINNVNLNCKNFEASNQQSIFILLWQLLTMRKTWWQI